MPSISNTDNTIDSRDVIKELAESLSECESIYQDAVDAGDIDPDETTLDQYLEESEDYEVKNYRVLKALDDDGDGIHGWRRGVTLIHENYFQTYAEEYADDVYGMQNNRWPFNHIDWMSAADELQQDYSVIDYDGQTYYVRE